MILAVDPGVTTGWVTFTPVTRLEITVHEWDETRGENAFEKIAWEYNRQHGVNLCVCEAFEPWKDNKARTWQPASLHVIGALRFIFGEDRVDLHQSASDANRWGTPEKLAPYRGQGMKSPTGDDHVFMALRHALKWTANTWDGRQW